MVPKQKKRLRTSVKDDQSMGKGLLDGEERDFKVRIVERLEFLNS